LNGIYLRKAIGVLVIFVAGVTFSAAANAQAVRPCAPSICVTEGSGGSCTPQPADASCSVLGNAPALEGYGTSSTFGGGPNSETCVVSNLNDSGAGSFRTCIEDRNGTVTNPVPRTVEFSVGGTITLIADLRIRQPYLTIDGLSAPSPGITIAKAGDGTDGESEIQTWPEESTCGHDVLLQGLRFRGVWTRNTTAHSQNADNIMVDGEDFTGCLKNIVIWRNTFIDGQDAVGSFWGSVTDVTFGYNLVVYNFHPQVISHAPGGESGQERERFSLHHNIYAYAYERIPNIRGNAWDINLDQNIFHKWSSFNLGNGYATKFRCRGSGCPMRINLIENHWTSGGSRLGNAIDYEDGASPAQVYIRGNILPSAESDGGSASGEFARSDSITLFSDQDFVNSMFPFVGHQYPTAEESAVKQEVAQQVLSEL